MRIHTFFLYQSSNYKKSCRLILISCAERIKGIMNYLSYTKVSESEKFKIIYEFILSLCSEKVLLLFSTNSELILISCADPISSVQGIKGIINYKFKIIYEFIVALYPQRLVA